MFCAVRIVALKFDLDGRDITRVRGNKAHVASAGYTCEKGLRINHYQNKHKSIDLPPLKRIDDGSYLEVDWDTAIAEISTSLKHINESMVLKSSITAVGDKVIISEELTQQRPGKHMG